MTSGAESEIWLPVKGYEGYYEISNHGRLKSLARWRKTAAGYMAPERIIKPKTMGGGYHQYELRVNNEGRILKKSRLVASHFIPNPYNKEQVNHINGDRKDDRVENLEWATRAENIQHSYDFLNRRAAYKGKFGKEHNQSIPVVAMLNGRSFEFESKTQCANYFKVTVQAVAQAIKLKRPCKNHLIKEK